MKADRLRELKSRIKAAKSALRFFSDIKSVRSMNNPFAFPSKEEKKRFYATRNCAPNDVIHDFHKTATIGRGNCDEKARMCYASLATNPRLHKCYVTICSAIDYDHVFVVISDEPIQGPTAFSNLGKNAMVVDGWTEDWYFPNISSFDTTVNGINHVPNPRQIVVRSRTVGHLFQPTETPVYVESINGELNMDEIGEVDWGF